MIKTVNLMKLTDTEDVFIVLGAAFVELFAPRRTEDGQEEHVLLTLAGNQLVENTVVTRSIVFSFNLFKFRGI